MPVSALMTDIVIAVNTSHFNLSELTEGMQLAIESTLQSAQQVCPVLSPMEFACVCVETVIHSFLYICALVG